MAKPSSLQKQELGPLAGPFERYNRLQPEEKKRFMKPREDEFFSAVVYDATEDGKPDGVLLTSKATRSMENKYIWVITPDGLLMAHETTPPHSELKRMCHSNLTGGKKAYQGGELWFLEDNSVVINFYSGRYGAENKIQEKAVIDYFHSVGYETVLVDAERV